MFLSVLPEVSQDYRDCQWDDKGGVVQEELDHWIQGVSIAADRDVALLQSGYFPYLGELRFCQEVGFVSLRVRKIRSNYVKGRINVREMY